MILGLPASTYTSLHITISLIAIVSGLIVWLGMIRGRYGRFCTALFLGMTVLTSVTGLLFPLPAVTPAVILAILSLAVLAVALFALYGKHLAGAARAVYVVTAGLALYFNAFALVAQMFQKIAVLRALAPTQSEPPFLIAELLLLAFFLVTGYLAVRRFHPGGATPT